MSLIATLLLWSSIRSLAVMNPIAVAAPAGEDSALYLVVRNSAQEEDRLLGVTCACAERVEIHNMVTRDGRRHMDVEPSLALPPARLVEVPPGGARHLMLMGLRRPLVAGERVPMTFRFATGQQTLDVQVVADSRAGWAAALIPHGAPRLAPMAFLAGSCWRGTFPDGRRTDTHCFSPIYNLFLQDHHVVEGGPTPYSGYTLYSHDVMGRSTRFEYRASDGSRSLGGVIPTGTGLSFPGETTRLPDGREMTIRSAWTRDGADAYLVRAEASQGEGWRELWQMRMVRVGPSPPQ